MGIVTFAHYAEKAQAFARSLGFGGRFAAADRLGEPGYGAEVLEWCRLGGQYVLELYPTEARLRNEYHEWQQFRNTFRWMRDHGIAGQCQALQIGDELWDWLYTLEASKPGPWMQHWPSLVGHAHPWSTRWYLALLLAQRADDLRAYWREEGLPGPCPRIGTAISGGVAPPQWAGQDYWGLNVYQRGREERHRRAVQSIYAQVYRATYLPLMPVLPMYRGQDTQPTIPSIVDLAVTYAQPYTVAGRDYPAIIDHPQNWAVGVFCVRWPGEDNPAHGDGSGLTRLHVSYSHGVQQLTAHLAGRT